MGKGLPLRYDPPPLPSPPPSEAPPPSLPFHTVAHLPSPDDNAAIALTSLDARTTMLGAPHAPLALTHPLLEGHRFSVASIRAGELITSWGEPFGRALLPISPGEWIRNAKTLGELKRRRERGALGCEYPNFEDYIKPCTLSEPNFKPADPVPLSLPDETFEGFIRPEGRGVGTRNYGVLLCVSSRSNAFARALERRLRTSSAFSARGGFDGVSSPPPSQRVLQTFAAAPPPAMHKPSTSHRQTL